MDGGDPSVVTARNHFGASGDAVYGLALAHRLTKADVADQSNYADKAVSVLDAWGVRAPTVHQNAHAGLHIGSHFIGLPYAVDLLRGYPALENTVYQRLRNWWYGVMVSKMRMTIDRGMPGPASNPTAQDLNFWANGDPDIDPGGGGSNWLECAMSNMLATAIAFEDDDLQDEIITRFTSYFAYNDWRIYNVSWGPPNGSTTVSVMRRDIDRSTGTGSNAVAQGPSYTGHGGAGLVQAFEMARRLGTDLWNATTPGGADVRKVYEAYWRWMYLGQSWNHPQHAGKALKDNKCGNILELLNNRHPTVPGLQAFLDANRPMGSDSDHRNPWPTLTDGDM